MPRKSKSATTVRRAGNVITFIDIAKQPDPQRLKDDLPGLIVHRVDGELAALTLTFENDATAKEAYARMFAGDDSLPDSAGGVAGVDLFTHRDDRWPDTDADGELAEKLIGSRGKKKS